jgi:hypothetical protein
MAPYKRQTCIYFVEIDEWVDACDEIDADMPIRSAGAGKDKKLKAVLEHFQEDQTSIDGNIDCAIRTLYCL